MDKKLNVPWQSGMIHTAIIDDEQQHRAKRVRNLVNIGIAEDITDWPASNSSWANG